MKTFLVITVFLTVAAARPGWSKIRLRKDNQNFLSSLFGRTLDHQRRQVASGNCKQLSAAAAEVITALIPYAQQQMDDTDIDIGEKFDIMSDLYLGFDFLDDHDDRDALYCAATSASSVADLKDKLDGQHDYNYGVFRMVYDVVSAAGISFDVLAPDVVGEQIDPIVNFGLLSLDLEGTAVIGDIVLTIAVDLGEKTFAEILSSIDLPMASSDNLEYKCQTIQNLINQAVQALPQRVVMKFYMATGVDLTDQEQTYRLIYDIMASAPEGLRSVYEVIDNEGIVLTFHEFIYPMIQQYVRMYISQLQMIIMMSEMEGDSGNASGMSDAEMNLIRLWLRYLQEMEASGLLSLQ